MKKKIILAVLVATLLTGCGKTIPTLSDGKEAVITFKDGSMISIDDLYEKMKNNFATSIVVEMVDTKLLEERYEEKLDDALEYAKNYIESLKKYYTDENNNFDEAKFMSDVQQAYGYSSIESFQNSVRLNYLRNEMVKDYVEDNITDKEIEKYYKDEIVGDRDVYHIQVIPEVKSTMTSDEKKAAEEKALEEAKALIARIKKGEKFEDVAKEASDDDATKENGGGLGFINKGTYGSDEFDKEVYALKVGEYSNTPVKTSSGYEIIYVKEEKEKQSLDDAKDSIKEKLGEEKLEKDATLQVKAIEEMRKEAGVDIVDSELKSSYEKYMNNLMRSARNQNSSTEK